ERHGRRPVALGAAVGRTLRRWLALDEPVDRPAYLVSGLVLMALKYALDAAVVWLVTRQVWTPLDYMIPSLALRQAKLRVVPAWLVVAMVLWSLPFLWIGVSMTVRRALDAGRSPWLAALFFVPVVNYAVMLALGAAPSRPRAQAPEPHPVAPASVRSLLASLGV